MKITKIEMPKDGNWGILQINNFTETFFRFEIVKGKAVLDNSMFANKMTDPEKRHQRIDKSGDFYQGIQRLLDDYIDGLGLDITKQKAYLNERRHLLGQLESFLDLMQVAINKLDMERYEKIERDFNHVVGQLAYVGKRE